MSLAAGTTIGNYRVIAKIGTGGMGAVYLAEHPLIGKKVALKVIHKELASNQEVVKRFFQEAQAVNKIGNEHIVEIHDFDCDCAACAPYVPSDPDRLTAVDMGKLATLGAVVGSAIMFAIDPVGAPAALRSAIGL